jgi:hypothetical protein
VVAFTWHPDESRQGAHHTPEIAMTDATRTAPATGDAEIDALFAEIDGAFRAWSRSIDRGLALAAEMRQLADTIDAGLADARAELDEWI